MIRILTRAMRSYSLIAALLLYWTQEHSHALRKMETKTCVRVSGGPRALLRCHLQLLVCKTAACVAVSCLGETSGLNCMRTDSRPKHLST